MLDCFHAVFVARRSAVRRTAGVQAVGGFGTSAVGGVCARAVRASEGVAASDLRGDARCEDLLLPAYLLHFASGRAVPADAFSLAGPEVFVDRRLRYGRGLRTERSDAQSRVGCLCAAEWMAGYRGCGCAGASDSVRGLSVPGLRADGQGFESRDFAGAEGQGSFRVS